MFPALRASLRKSLRLNNAQLWRFGPRVSAFKIPFPGARRRADSRRVRVSPARLGVENSSMRLPAWHVVRVLRSPPRTPTLLRFPGLGLEAPDFPAILVEPRHGGQSPCKNRRHNRTQDPVRLWPPKTVSRSLLEVTRRLVRMWVGRRSTETFEALSTGWIRGEPKHIELT